jgi:hypothetical protein
LNRPFIFDEVDDKISMEEFEAKIKQGTDGFQKMVQGAFNQCDKILMNIEPQMRLRLKNDPSKQLKGSKVTTTKVETGEKTNQDI